MYKRLFVCMLLGFFLLPLFACAKPEMVLPEHIKTMSVPIFKNLTRRYGIEAEITQGIARELSQSGRVIVVTKGQADAVLLGKVIDYHVTPVSFDKKDFVTQYQLTVAIS